MPTILPANKVPSGGSEKRDKATSTTAQSTPPTLRDESIDQILLTWLIQVTALAAAIVFGVFSILSWVDSQHAKAQAKTANSLAKSQADTANLLAIAAICAQSGDKVP